jgi:predicted phage terminase large subunit-like protein
MLLTVGGSIQSIIRDPEVTRGIFSFKKKLAKDLFKQIKTELETNELLKWLFDDILHQDPRREAVRWSEDGGIVVKRRGNPKEATLNAYGLIDDMPTGAHFREIWFDDAVDATAASTEYMMQKAEDAMRMTIGALGTHDKVFGGAGTRWRMFDAYGNLAKSGVFKLREIYCTDDRTRYGTPLYLTKEEHEAVLEQFSPYQYSSQMQQNPVQDSSRAFKVEWLKRYVDAPAWKKLNRYIIVDPATSKKVTSDNTAMLVMGLNEQGNWYLLDAVVDKLSLSERIRALFELHRRWQPMAVGYERYGLQSDIEAVQMAMNEQMYHFHIVELAGKLRKTDRIEGLMPIAEQGKLYLPSKLVYKNWEGQVVDLVDYFITMEYAAFPMGAHDDMLDAMARITDSKLGAVKPAHTTDPDVRLSRRREEEYEGGGTWLSA